MSSLDTPEYLATCDVLVQQAKKTVEALIDARAGKFAQCPSQLDLIEPKLSALSPRKMRARIIELIDIELSAPRRWVGFGGEIPLMNLNAAERYAARLCQIAGQSHGRAAFNKEWETP